jgi:hypothetical protein
MIRELNKIPFPEQHEETLATVKQY